MGKGGCAGVMVLCGPPTVGGACYYVWISGRDRMLRSLRSASEGVSSSASANFASFTAAVAAYGAQALVIMPAFDQGGALSLDWKKGTESLGQPLKIATWSHFWRATGPPVFARVGALIFSFYVAGNVHGWASASTTAAASATASPTPVPVPASSRRGGKQQAAPPSPTATAQASRTQAPEPIAIPPEKEDYFQQRDRLKREKQQRLLMEQQAQPQAPPQAQPEPRPQPYR